MIKGLYGFARRWSENGAVWLFSDPHFDDTDCKIIDGNWPNPREQVDIIKSKCHKNDTLIILGDIGNPAYLREIKSYLVLIAGNHDRGLSYYSEYFDEMYKGILSISDKIVLSHEPIYISAKEHDNVPFMLNIHGHRHLGEPGLINGHFNVAADVINYEPVNLGDLIKSGITNFKTIHRYAICDR